MDSGLILPPGVGHFRPEEDAHRGDRVMVVNETGLPDNLVEGAIADHFVESASMAWGHQTTFQSYANQGSLLARADFRVPGNVIEEIRLARDMAERDDDVSAVIGWCIAAAFESGMENFHEDERTKALYDAVAKNMNLDRTLYEFYRELLISSQLNSLMLFTRENLEFQPFGTEGVQQESVAAPLAGVLPAENIRVLGNDIFGTATLAYDPDSPSLRSWLDEYFDPRTSPGRKAEMGRKDRVSANMFTGVVEIDPLSGDAEDLPYNGYHLYILNPRMVHRTTFPKGACKYPRPKLTSNFALLEAKRLLNIMDYALLQGGSNFIVIAKKGTDERPAVPAEIENLKDVVRKASRTGVIVGDHRLSFDILTPDLKELLNPSKRRLIGRKLAMALMRTPEHGTEEPGGEGMKAELEMQARVITADRHLVKRHIEGTIYDEVRKRNREVFTKGTPQLFFPKVILQSTQFFTDYILKLRDRGDIPRAWAVEAAGFPFQAAIQQRQREIDNHVDDTLAPAAVPFSSPDMGPQDNNDGRPPGAQTGRPTQDPARPTRRIQRNPGETIRAKFEPDLDRVVRAGEITKTILEEYPEYAVGRVKSAEREAIEGGRPVRKGPLVMVPVNPDYEVADEKALNLTDGLRVIVGYRRGDRAVVAKLLVFREPEFDAEEAELRTARWGYPIPDFTAEEEPEREPVANPEGPNDRSLIEAIAEMVAKAPQPVFNVEIKTDDKEMQRVILRDEQGRIIGSKEVPVDAEGDGE